MKLTITVANYNRGWFLDRSIRLFGKQTFPQADFDVVVVDDGSTDQSDSVVKYHKQVGTVKNLRYVKRKRPRSQFGNCAIARNIGITCGEGEIVLFTDPEVMPLLDWAQKHYLANCGEISNESGPKKGLLVKSGEIPDVSQIKTGRYVIGRALLLRQVHLIDGNSVGTLSNNVLDDFNWVDIGKTWDELHRRMQNIPYSEEKIRNEFFIYQFSQAGISASRKLLNTIRGFEEDFANPKLGLDKWAGEDAWFMRCADMVGTGVVQESSARAVHLPHEVITHGCFQCDVAHKKSRDNPKLCESNLGRSWGQVEENGFERIF